MGRGQQAKETREKLGSIFSEGMNYMKELKRSAEKGEIVAKINEEKRNVIMENIKTKDNV